MADEIERLLVRIEANAQQFENQMKRVNRALYGSAAQNRKTLDQIRRDTARQSRTLFTPIGESFRNEIRGLAGVFAATFTAQQIVRYADGFTALTNRLKVAGLAGQELADVQNHLFDSASRNGVAVSSLGELYGRLALTTGELGISQNELLQFTDGVTAALRVQGASSQAASGALLQLSQTLGSGTVRAEELNSILEGTPIILQAAANGAGVSVSELAARIREGEVSSREFFDALMRGFPAIQAQAENATLTIGQSLESLSNRLMQYIGATDSSLSATERMAQAIQALADNLDVVVTAAGVAVTIVGTRLAMAFVVATTEAIRYQSTLLGMAAAQTNVSRTALLASASLARLRAAALFFVTNPIGIAITAVATALALVALRGDEASATMSEMDQATSNANDALDRYEEAARDAAAASGESAVQARQNAAAMREEAVAAVNAARALRERAAAAAQQALQEANERANNPDGGRGERAMFRQRADYTRGQALIATMQAFAAETRLDSIERRIRDGSFVPPSGGAAISSGGGSGGRSGPSEEDVRRAEEEAAAYAKEKRDQAEILAIENQRAELAKQKEESESAAADRITREADAARDRLYMERELARLSGDDEALRAAESRLWVEERINELLRLRPELSQADARAIAEGEDAQLAEALRTGEARSAFRSIFVEAADDLDSALLNVADRFKQRLLENLADQLFDIFANASKGMGGGGGWMSTFASLFSRGFASGGYTGAGARMQPAGIVHKGEVVWSQSDIARAGGVAAVESMRRGMASGGASRKVIEHVVRVVPERDSFINLAESAAQRPARAAESRAVRTSTSIAQKSAPGMQKRMRRLGTP